MQNVQVFLNLHGTTDEALKLYASVFGTKVVMRQTFGESTVGSCSSPPGSPIPGASTL